MMGKKKAARPYSRLSTHHEESDVRGEHHDVGKVRVAGVFLQDGNPLGVPRGALGRHPVVLEKIDEVSVAPHLRANTRRKKTAKITAPGTE